ncbi:hypothetical protein C8R44DRAFT_187425 [Mycena epipterygia]|nr:hypothetical protein C8R44DRAFT_187425 [Mycena epipterygia]
MAIPTTILEAAGRAYVPDTPKIQDVRDRLEWAWGLQRHSFDEHLAKFPDPNLGKIISNDALFLLADPNIIRSLFLASSSSAAGKLQRVVQELCQDNKSFEYMVLPVDPSSGVAPRLLSSLVPPHLTISISVDKIFKRWGYTHGAFDMARDSFLTLVETSPPDGVTFTPTLHTFINLRFIHERWSIVDVPPHFLGLDDLDEESNATSSTDDGESSVDDGESSADDGESMEVPLWGYMEPRHRLEPHEFAQESLVAIRQLPAPDHDDTNSCDSGVEDPAKTSLAQEDYEPNRVWWTEMNRWVQSTTGIVDDRMLWIDGEIEGDAGKKPHVATIQP